MPTKVAELSEYERQRQEKIAKNKALLQQLQLDSAAAGLGVSKSKAASKPSTQTTGQKRKRQSDKIKKEELAPRRTSSRIRGIVADSEVAQQKAEEERDAFREAERIKRQRVSDDLNLGDVLVNGNWNQSGNFLRNFGPAEPGQRTFTDQDIKDTTDKELRDLRKRLNGLELWEDMEPARIKITPERIYSLLFHPSTEKPLVFAGDKMGNLGLFDASQKVPSNVKKEEDDDAEEEELDDSDPNITTFKIHTRTISATYITPHDPSAIYTASYDSSIRKLDLNKGVAVEVWGPSDHDQDEPLSGVEFAPDDPHTVYFSTLHGRFGIHDTRTPSSSVDLLTLSDKKIGGFSLNPAQPHIIATASLDRTLKLWDLRKITGKGDERAPNLLGEHTSKLSVSHAAFNAVGQVATSSYDDTVKVYDYSDAASWKVGMELSDDQMEPATVIPHNNQTGRWVTM